MQRDGLPRSGTTADQDGVGAIDKALDVLFHLHKAGPQGVTAVARALQLPKSTTHRLLTVLARRGLLEKSADSLYRPGFALVALGYNILDADPVVNAARRPLEEAAVELGETFFLVRARAGALVVLHKEEGTGVLRAAPVVGSRVPVEASAAGRLFLAYAPEEVGAAAGLEAFAAQHAMDSGALGSAVAQAGERGWDANVEEWIPGMCVLSCAIRSRGRLLGVVALGAVNLQYDALGGERLAPRVLEVAERIARRVEGAGG